jgi:nucleotide-binding universal stress UspA family protein
MIAPKSILVATDFGEAADAALRYGRALAHTFGASIHVMHVSENFFMRAVAGDPRALHDAAVRTLHARLTSEDRRVLHAHAVVETSDDAAEAIVAYAQGAAIDLIVIGTHGRSGVQRALVGSVAEHVVRTAPCPVLTVRHPEREFVLPDAAATTPTSRIE